MVNRKCFGTEEYSKGNSICGWCPQYTECGNVKNKKSKKYVKKEKKMLRNQIIFE